MAQVSDSSALLTNPQLILIFPPPGGGTFRSGQKVAYHHHFGYDTTNTICPNSLFGPHTTCSQLLCSPILVLAQEVIEPPRH
jgi:hypothetical protein